jgi:hypothetical protein
MSAYSAKVDTGFCDRNTRKLLIESIFFMRSGIHFARKRYRAERAMKSLMLAVIITCAAETACFAEGQFWVVGNRATSKCDIVTSNPVIEGDIWFGDGPYASRAEAKLARSTISACPKNDNDKN